MKKHAPWCGARDLHWLDACESSGRIPLEHRSWLYNRLRTGPMHIKQLFRKERLGGLVAIALALAISGLFKGAAFARESFIAARFGLSAVTDAYFALQQFPLTLATYMYGAFALAFVPAYARGEKQGGLSWFAGFVALGLVGSVVLTALMIALGTPILHVLHLGSSPDVRSTLVLLSLCFAPVFANGLWAGICTARGHNLWAMSIPGFSYLFMTVALIALYMAGHLNNLSLPLSMALGFALVGLYSLAKIVPSSRGFRPDLRVWRNAEFRRFVRQLSASSLENVGYAGNQLLIIYFLSRSGTGAISSNSCAMRVAMLAFTLVAMPISQLVQSKLCRADLSESQMVLQRWLAVVALLMISCASVLVFVRFPLIRLVYMHGKFQQEAVQMVAALLPAWAAYVVVMSLNGILARYLFIVSRGSAYVRNQVVAYAAANVLRVLVAGRWSSQWIIWFSVAAEGCSMLLSLRLCFKDVEETSIHAVEPEAA